MSQYIILLSLIILPLTTWIPLTHPHPNWAIEETPKWLGTIALLLIIMNETWKLDKRLFALFAYLALRATTAEFTLGHKSLFMLQSRYSLEYMTSLEVLTFMALGIALITQCQHLKWNQVKNCFFIMGIIQVLYVVLQYMRLDPIWVGFELLQHDLFIVGTLGHKNHVGEVLAITGVVVSLFSIVFPIVWWFAALTIQSLTATIALSFALLVRIGVKWWQFAVLWSALCLTLYLKPPTSLQDRLVIWQTALTNQTWDTWLFGHGLGAWIYQIPYIHPTVNIAGQGMGKNVRYFQAHNDILQLHYDAGLFAIGLISWWLYPHIRTMNKNQLALLVAVVLTAMAGFPFHSPITAILYCTAIGVALYAKEA